MSRYFKKPNILTPVIIIAAFAFAFRLANIVTFKDEKAGVVMSATAASAEHTEEVKDEPPPLTKEDAAKSVKDTTDALAKGEGDKGAGDKAGGDKPEGPDSIKPPSVPMPAAPSYSTAEVEVLQSLAKRRDTLDAREKTIADREALLKAAEQEVDRKVTELKKLKADMEALLGQQEKADETRITSLVKIYENMKPKDAATIFDQLDMDILLEVVGRMNERKVSPILAGMSPQKAKDVTIKLAEERKLPAEKRAGMSAPAPQ